MTCRQPPTVRGPAGWSACHAVVRSLSGALRAGQPIALALLGRQSPAGGGASSWSTRCVCSAMPSAPYRIVSRLLLGALRTMSRLPAGFTEVISTPDILSDLETILRG
ncbi:hypothetical protein B296_00043323 [Ensete ventricosum]|uniref:Uncharacterized protein n=1 Tax=Ensete ventricosum TaxID=4639 RepID=A0A426ZF37_ENSVE|nr:hypothetical protein B296_00043323 [Ensete ventricosum]